MRAAFLLTLTACWTSRPPEAANPPPPQPPVVTATVRSDAAVAIDAFINPGPPVYMNPKDVADALEGTRDLSGWVTHRVIVVDLWTLQITTLCRADAEKLASTWTTGNPTDRGRPNCIAQASQNEIACAFGGTLATKSGVVVNVVFRDDHLVLVTVTPDGRIAPIATAKRKVDEARLLSQNGDC